MIIEEARLNTSESSKPKARKKSSHFKKKRKKRKVQNTATPIKKQPRRPVIPTTKTTGFCCICITKKQDKECRIIPLQVRDKFL